MNNDNNPRPFWWPDMQGFAVVAIVLVAAAALFIRMFHTSNVDDKMLDTMITILFSTCLVSVYNYLFGSSRGSASKDDMLNKIAGTATTPPVTPNAPGTTTTTTTTDAPKALSLLAVMVLGALLLWPQASYAQDRFDPIAKIKSDIAARTGKQVEATAASQLETIMSAVAKPFQDLADFINSDAAGAATLATVVPGLQDTNGKACWVKMQNAGAVFQAHPVPLTLKVMTDFESLRLLQMTANDLCAYTPCTVVFSDGANLATAVASAVGGAMTSNAVPSLTQLCARIPQLSPMLPAAVTGITATAPATTTPAASTPAPETPAATAPPSK